MSAEPVRVLHVDDDAEFLDLAATFLDRERESFEVRTATSVEEGLDRLDGDPGGSLRTGPAFDCIVSDYEMPGRDGLDFLEAVRGSHPQLPFVLFTGKGSEEIASEAITAGVTDYLNKGMGTDQYTILANRIENAVSKYRGERERERHMSAIEATDDALYVLDETGRFEFVNEAFRELTGYDAETVVGSEATLIKDERTAERFEERLGELLSAGEPETTVEFEVRTKTGETIPCEDHLAVRMTDGEFRGVAGAIRDISERKDRKARFERRSDLLERTQGRRRRLETLHDRSREMMRAKSRREVCEITVETAVEVLDLPLNGIWLHDEDEPALEPMAFSPRGKELFDSPPTYTPDDGSLSWEVFTTGETQIHQRLDNERAHNTRTPIESEMIFSLGGHGVMNVGATTSDAFEDDDIAFARLLVTTVETALDRTRRETLLKNRQRQLERQNERLDEFASTVSHDLRNPLTVANGRLELLAEDYESDHLDEIGHALDRMETLLEDTLTLARQGLLVDDPQPIALDAVAERALETVGDAPTLVESEHLPTVHADPDRLRTLFENLFRNAVEHGSPNDRGDSENALDRREDDVTVTIGALDEEGFYVADDGPGIPAAERTEVFEYGFSTEEGGTGLGLAITKNIAEAHGWTLSVTEAETGGARFEVTTGPTNEPDEPVSQRTGLVQ